MKDIEKTVYNAIKNGTYTTFDTLKDSYVHLYEEIIALQAENAKLTEQLKNAAVLPCKVGQKMTEIEKKEIEEIAEEIAFAIIGDVADTDDASSVAPIAEALYKAGYRKPCNG